MVQWLENKWKLVFAAMLAVFATTAWNSHGYYHADEHFQVIEFANYKAGNIPAEQLPWEFPAQIRPGFQPMLFFGIHQAGKLFGLDAFGIVTLARLFTTALVLLLLWLAAMRFGHSIFWLALLWFVPTLFCRFSSENLSGLCLAYGLLISRDTNKGWLITGVLLGLSFVFRFQMGFCILALTLLWFFKREFKPVTFFLYATGGLLMLVVLVLSDRWLYGEWVFTPWKYFEVNIVQNVANERFGVSPWYEYFKSILLRSIYLPGLLLLFCTAFYCLKNRKSELTWAVLPFVFIHILIGHKELRFLFPMLVLVLFMAADLLRSYSARAKWAVYVVLVFFPVTLYRCVQPMKVEVNALRIAAERGGELCYIHHHPLLPFGMMLQYYNQPGISVAEGKDLGACPLIYAERNEVKDIPHEVVFQRIPEWVIDVADINNWSARTKVYGVYKPAE